MKRRTVHVSTPVQDQIRRQALYIARDSVENAIKWESRLLSVLDSLSDFHGHAIDQDASRRLGGTIRKVVFEKTYLIHYEVNEAARIVEILNFRHGARLPRPDEP